MARRTIDEEGSLPAPKEMSLILRPVFPISLYLCTAGFSFAALTLSGETAIAAVEDGSEMTATIQAKYMAASMNKKDQESLEDDDSAAGDATANTNSDETDTEAQERISWL